MVTTMDCGDRTCDVEYRLLPTCILHVDISEEKHCQYPCSTTNCATELHNFMLCPTWICTSKTTTTSSPTLPTLSPWPTSSTNCSASSCIPSLVFNGLFGLLFLSIAAFVYFTWKRNRRLSAFFHSSTNPLFEAEAGFDYFQNQRRPIIRAQPVSERHPLIEPSLSRSSERDALIEPHGISNPSQRGLGASGPSSASSAVLFPSIQETQF